MQEFGDVDDEEEWFGDGSAFDSGEDLAAALMVMAGSPIGVEPPGAGIDRVIHPPRAGGEAFEEVTRSEQEVQTVGGRDESVGWAVREPRARPAGKRGWSIRNSVQSIRLAESTITRLRRDAVLVAWRAAGVAIAQRDGGSGPAAERVAAL